MRKDLSLRDIVDIVILASAFLVAVVNIYNFFAKPTSFFKKRQAEASKKRTAEVLDELMPKYLENYSQKVDDMLAQEKKELEAIKCINEEQNKTIDLLRKNILDVLRQKIENIYYKYRAERKMPQYVKEALDELYTDYRAGGGNHHIVKLYSRMEQWEVYASIPEYDREE